MMQVSSLLKSRCCTLTTVNSQHQGWGNFSTILKFILFRFCQLIKCWHLMFDRPMDTPRAKGTVVLMLAASIAAFVVSASVYAEGLSRNTESASGWRQSRQSNSLTSSHRLSGNSKATGTRQNTLTLGASAESASGRRQEISNHLLGGPNTYEDSYRASMGYGSGIEAADSYESMPEERAVLPRTVSRADNSGNGRSFPGAGGARSPAEKPIKAGSNSSSLRSKSLAGQYADPFGGAGSNGATERIYQSPW